MSGRSISSSAHIHLGLLVAGVGIGVGILIELNPEGLAVPMWVAKLACLTFVFAGAAMAIRREDHPVLHHCTVLAILITMTAIPAWISLGPGERHCTSNIPGLASDTSCRVVFGFSTLFGLLMLAAALREMWLLIKR